MADGDLGKVTETEGRWLMVTETVGSLLIENGTETDGHLR